MTKHEAMIKLFSRPQLKAALRMQKYYYLHNELSERKQTEILKKCGYKIKQEEVWELPELC